MHTKEALANEHSWKANLLFRLKTNLLTLQRIWLDCKNRIPHFSKSEELRDAEILAESRTPLWNPNDTASNWILTAGKIENLRIASKRLDGLVIPAHQTFSFWQHIGNPNFGKQYVVGREIREGCIVPTKAGGLCQLSNALYDSALKAHFQILERHKHTRVIKGSLAEQDRDATVKWKHIDLRFTHSHPFRIEVELTAEELVVRLKSLSKINHEVMERRSIPTSFVNDCFSCGNTLCDKHPKQTDYLAERSHTTYILDENWPEYAHYVKEHVLPTDTCILTVKDTRFLPLPRYRWNLPKSIRRKYTFWAGIRRALDLRIAQRLNKNTYETALVADQRIAKAIAHKIPVSATHLVIPQHLLPFLAQEGALGGRTYDVLMYRLPLQQLHEHLDHEKALHIESSTLADFRAAPSLVTIEEKALKQARRIITPHAVIASLYPNKAIQLDWHIPFVETVERKKGLLVFPASTIGRKGAYHVRTLARELHLSIAMPARNMESSSFWQGIQTLPFDGDHSKVGLVIYPAIVENQPRQLLRFLAAGIPVIAYSSCGIPAHLFPHLQLVDDYAAMKEAVAHYLVSENVISA